MIEPLFSRFPIQQLCEQRLQKVRQAVDELAPDQLLNTDPDELLTYLTDKHTLTTPVPLHDLITLDQAEIKIDVSRDPQRRIRDRSRPFYITGTRYTYFVPFCDFEQNL